MQRREIIKLLGVSTLAMSGNLLPLRVLGQQNNSKKNTIKNWAWTIPVEGKSIDYWKKQMSRAKQFGIDGIILEVYNGTDSFFDNSRLPVKEDVLSKLIPVCHSLELEIHTWMWTMPCNIPEMVEKHPDWYAVNGKGESAALKPAYVDYYKFLDPCNEHAQEFIKGNLESLAGINEIDGVHLDYVRLPDVILAEALQPKYNIVQDKEYPEYDYSYSTKCRELFKQQTGIDPLIDLENPSANDAWRQFRYDSVTNLVNGELVPIAKKYKKPISAAVFPNWYHVRQEWKNWDLDAFMPMLYNSFYGKGIDWITEKTHEGIVNLKSPKPVYSGLFVPALSAEELKQVYINILNVGGSGVSLFNLESMDDNKWKALKEARKKIYL